MDYLGPRIKEITGPFRVSYVYPRIETRVRSVYCLVMEDRVDPYRTLTFREREVLTHVAEGYTNVEIATRLGISSRTVESHRANFMRKLGLHTLAEVIKYALRRGILFSDI